MTETSGHDSGESLPVLERFKYPIFLLIAVALLAGVVALLSQRPDPTTVVVNPPEPTLIPSPTPVPSSTPTPGPYTVYITGAVASPEVVVTLSFGSRVLDAISAAGGPQSNADLERVNLAQLLADGDQVQVPTRPPVEDEPTVVIRAVTPTAGFLMVYVTGEVLQPQSMIVVPNGSRVEYAIEAAGGPTDDADLAAVNLSQILNDGDQVHVPSLQGPDIQTPTPNHPLLVHINYASVEEIATLPGIGPSLAQAIIDYRAENGPFASLEELDNVPGIGSGKLEDIRDRVVLD